MSTITAENILTLIEQLPATEQDKFRQLWDAPTAVAATTNGHTPAKPRDKCVYSPVSPEEEERGRLSMNWVHEHQREYKKQYVALEGDRLIAASPDFLVVKEALEKDSAKIPFFTYIQDPDNIIHIIWT